MTSQMHIKATQRTLLWVRWNEAEIVLKSTGRRSNSTLVLYVHGRLYQGCFTVVLISSVIR